MRIDFRHVAATKFTFFCGDIKSGLIAKNYVVQRCVFSVVKSSCMLPMKISTYFVISTGYSAWQFFIRNGIHIPKLVRAIF